MRRRHRRPRPHAVRRLAVALRAVLRAWARQREASARQNLVDSLQSQVPDDRANDPQRRA